MPSPYYPFLSKAITVTRTVWIWAMPMLKYNQGNNLATGWKQTHKDNLSRFDFESSPPPPPPPSGDACVCFLSHKKLPVLVYQRMIWSLWEVIIIRRNCIFVTFGSIWPIRYWVFINILQCISIYRYNSMIRSDISKVLYVISRAVRRVKFETILKYHEWYLCQISRTNHAIICLYYYPHKVCNFHM